MKFFASAALIAFSIPACAQQVSGEKSASILADGKVLTFSDVSENGPATMGQLPKGSRIHEAYVLDGGALFLCYMIGSNMTGTAPRATCFGPR